MFAALAVLGGCAAPGPEPGTQGKIEVLWLGNAAMRITTVAGKVILIDPFITNNPTTPAQYKNLDALGKIDLILVLLAGKADIIIPQPQDVNEHLASGKLRALAAVTERRLAVLPGVATVREQGIEIPIIANTRGIVGPPGMPKAAARYWEDWFARLVRTPSWRKYLLDNQVEDIYANGAQLEPYLKDQVALMRRMLREAGVAVQR